MVGQIAQTLAQLVELINGYCFGPMNHYSARVSILFGLGFHLAMVACQSQSKPAVVVRAEPAVAKEVPALAPLTDSTPASEPSPTATPEAYITKAGPPVTDIAGFLAANKLAEIWQATAEQGESTSRPTILEGFYGTEHRHIAFIFDRVYQDTLPNTFRVQGRSRFRKITTPFEGTFAVTRIKGLKAFLDLDSAAVAHARAYSVTAHYVLREDSTDRNAGTYQGTALLDFYRLASGELQLLQSVSIPDKDLPAQGAGQLFRGQWQSRRTGRRNPVDFAVFSQAVVPDAMADLFLGDRGEVINPKYANLGWSEGWENQEWWAKSPKPKLSL